MDKIDYEEDRVHSITQADAAKSLSGKVIELKNLAITKAIPENFWCSRLL